MLVSLANCKKDIEDAVQAELKSKSVPEILGYRFIKGPWVKTFILEVDTLQETLSCFLVEGKTGLLEMAAPFKVIKKEKKNA